MQPFSVICHGILLISFTSACIHRGSRAGAVTELADITVSELSVDDYQTYKITFTSSPEGIAKIGPVSLKRGDGKQAITVTPGKYHIALDYFNGGDKAIYSADYCTAPFVNNDVTLVSGKNSIQISICRADANMLKTVVSIEPGQSVGNAQPAKPADTSAEVKASMATHFDAMGGATEGNIGACGVPQENLESVNFVALNVQNTPADYATFLNRPIAQDIYRFNFPSSCNPDSGCTSFYNKVSYSTN